MNNSEIEKDSRKPINIENVHVVERKYDMNLNDFIKKIREKTQHVLAEEANEPNYSKN